jgi:hypothetical protein
VVGEVGRSSWAQQEIVDQYALAMSAAGLSDGHIRQTRAVVIEFARSVSARAQHVVGAGKAGAARDYFAASLWRRRPRTQASGWCPPSMARTSPATPHAGLEISAGKMSSWWAGTPPTMRLEELDVLCAVLECTPNDLMTPEPDKVAARRPRSSDAANGGNGDDNPDGNGVTTPAVSPRFGKPRSTPPLKTDRTRTCRRCRATDPGSLWLPRCSSRPSSCLYAWTPSSTP